MFDVVAMWKEEATNVSGRGLPCGHLILEEESDGLLDALESFLQRMDELLIAEMMLLSVIAATTNPDQEFATSRGLRNQPCRPR
jgi:hypothetical protein